MMTIPKTVKSVIL